MLVLTRNVGDKVVIGGNIILTVMEVKGNRARLGFEAPKDIQIDRLEVALRHGRGPQAQGQAE